MDMQGSAPGAPQGAPQGAPAPTQGGSPPVPGAAPGGPQPEAGQDPQAVASTLASMAAGLVAQADAQAKGAIPDEVIVPAAREVLAMLMEASLDGAPNLDEEAPQDEPDVTPEEQANYDRVITAARKIIYDNDDVWNQVSTMFAGVPYSEEISNKALVLTTKQLLSEYGVDEAEAEEFMAAAGDDAPGMAVGIQQMMGG